MENKTIGIIIVEYKSADETVSYIKEELLPQKISSKVVIVSNCANIQSLQKYSRFLKADIISENKYNLNKDNHIFVIPSNQNLGFAKGNNIGADFLIQNFKCKYLLFTNNDIKIPSANTVADLITKLENDTSIGMIGPKIIGLNGKCQSPEPFRKIEDRFVWMYLSTPFITNRQKVRKFKLDYSENALEGYHYKIMGSFFIMPSKSFIEIEGMYPNTFLYSEESILSEKLKRIGQKVYYFPNVYVIHAHSKTISKHLKKYKKNIIQAQSERYYYMKYCGVPKWKCNICYVIFKCLSFLKSLYK